MYDLENTIFFSHFAKISQKFLQIKNSPNTIKLALTTEDISSIYNGTYFQPLAWWKSSGAEIVIIPWPEIIYMRNRTYTLILQLEESSKVAPGKNMFKPTEWNTLEKAVSVFKILIFIHIIKCVNRVNMDVLNNMYTYVIISWSEPLSDDWGGKCIILVWQLKADLIGGVNLHVLKIWFLKIISVYEQDIHKTNKKKS